jgi:murein DD-endopeptidase MepM/ murein hydrolase activator NlpD
MAARDGEVVCTHNNVATSSGFGKFVVLKHMDGNYTRYAHLQEIKVEKGQQLIEGTVLGLLGNTGTQYCHLHFEVFRDSMRVIQTGHWRPWRYYPSNQSKAWVQQHYINPWEWLKTPQEKDDLEVAYDWAKNIKLIKSSLPKDTVQIDQLCVILDRFREYFKL